MKINLILLAAGNSKRFNGNKLLAIYKEKPKEKADQHTAHKSAPGN